MPRIDNEPAVLIPEGIIFNDKDSFMNQGRKISIFGGIEKELERDEDVGAEKRSRIRKMMLSVDHFP
jgi:hypothetical protein